MNAIAPTTIKEENKPVIQPQRTVSINQKWNRFTKNHNGTLCMIERDSNHTNTNLISDFIHKNCKI